MPAIKAYRSKYNKTHVIYESADGTKTVRSGGSRSWRCNDPGNLKSRGGFAGRHGSIGSDGVNAVFPDYDTGRAAMAALLTGPRFSDKSINDAIAIWAPASDGNNVPAYQNYIKSHTQLDMSIKISSLSASDLELLRKAMETYEGYKEGTPDVEMKTITATKSKNDKNFTDFEVDGKWITKAQAVEMVKADKLDAVVVKNSSLRPSPGKPTFESIEQEATDEEEGEKRKSK